MQNKYVILKQEDCHKHLDPDQQQQLINIIQTIQQGRNQEGKGGRQPFYFVLNMHDTFAQAGIEAYINAIVADERVRDNPGVQAALATARAVRNEAMLRLRPDLPDQEVTGA